MVAAVYNKLLDVEEAAARFKDREATLLKLAPLMHKYDDIFGIIIPHSHAELTEHEIMLINGNTTKPTVPSTDVIFPSAWLGDGTIYEYSTTPTADLPPELVKEFQAIVGKDSPLGLYYVGHDHKDLVQVERSKNGVQTTTYHHRDELPEHEKATVVGWLADNGVMKTSLIYIYVMGRHL